jgi:hypothetical protein
MALGRVDRKPPGPGFNDAPLSDHRMGPITWDRHHRPCLASFVAARSSQLSSQHVAPLEQMDLQRERIEGQTVVARIANDFTAEQFKTHAPMTTVCCRKKPREPKTHARRSAEKAATTSLQSMQPRLNNSVR